VTRLGFTWAFGLALGGMHRFRSGDGWTSWMRSAGNFMRQVFALGILWSDLIYTSVSKCSYHPTPCIQNILLRAISYAFDTLYRISEDDVWMRVHSKVMACDAEGDYL
jgi:hypothetical protein